MKYRHSILTALVALSASLATADELPLVDANTFGSDESTYALRKNADEKLGLQWTGNAAYGLWGAAKGMGDYEHSNNIFLLHVQAAQEILKDSDGGLWLRAELCGSLGLDASTRRAETPFSESNGGVTSAQADYMGGNEWVIPEIILMKFFNKGKVGVYAGMVNLTNHFDAVGIANDSYLSFANSAFVNSNLLPLVDSNLGGIVQYAPNDKQTLMLGAARTCTEPGFNPFSDGRGYTIIGEYTHSMADGKFLCRINPYYENTEYGGEDRFGLAGSIEYQCGEYVSTFVRTGIANNNNMGNTFDFSVGAHFSGIPSRENDYLGVAFGLVNPGTPDEEEPVSRREYVMEVMYNLHINDYVSIVPHFQYIGNPSFNEEHDQAVIFGVQAVLSF